MKKNLLLSAALSVLMFVGIGTPKVQAQGYYQAPPLNPEYEPMAKQIVELNTDDPEAANKVYLKLMKKIIKSKNDLVSVADYFLKNESYAAALNCVTQLDKQNLVAEDETNIHMFMGEVYMKCRQYSKAGAMYEQAFAADSNYVPAIKRLGFVYKNINPEVSIEYLERLQRIQPDNYDVDKEIGDIYYKQTKLENAIERYGIYYNRVPKDTTVMNFNACQNYMFAHLPLGEFEKAGQLATEFLKYWPNAMVFKRTRFITDVEINETDSAALHMAYVINKEYNDTAYTVEDYTYVARYYVAVNEIEPAIEYYKKVLEVASKKEDTKKNIADAYKNLASLYGQNQQAELGLETFMKYLEVIGDKADLTDKYLLARRYVAVYQQEDVAPERKQQCFEEADKLFSEIMEKKPDFVDAYVQRARLNNTDPKVPNETVKNFFMKVIEITEETPDKYKRPRFEACQYLFFYAIYVEPNDMQLARRVLDIAAGIDPNHKFVQQATKFMEMSN